MSKEVKRYGMCGFESGIVEMEDGPFVDADDYDALLAERDAILLQAQIWAGEAKTQKATIDEVGKILGGVPDWGPIAAGVEQLKKDAERLDRLDIECEAYGFEGIHEGNRWMIDGPYKTVRDAIDAAMQGVQP